MSLSPSPTIDKNQFVDNQTSHPNHHDHLTPESPHLKLFTSNSARISQTPPKQQHSSEHHLTSTSPIKRAVLMPVEMANASISQAVEGDRSGEKEKEKKGKEKDKEVQEYAYEYVPVVQRREGRNNM
ncbi:hypothetical protein M231_02906 [Tremella mesenterica]|uniref:Uncharacterized protein n=1 Tax=Tremella mesenterica TaxID=5217 RepID=A0A4Q1BPL4_TREME|nr:hypothetical protein M231_02906 [Tremella mesenterica]